MPESVNHIASIALYGVCWLILECITGLFRLSEFSSAEDSVVDEMLRLEPVELVVAEYVAESPLGQNQSRFPNIVINTMPSYSVNYNSCRDTLEHFGAYP